jgi:glycosyltransferase involved in cell wall biosynthesis
MMKVVVSCRKLSVFVLLPSHLDAIEWNKKYREGAVPDGSPYGYHHAEAYGVSIQFSLPTGGPDSGAHPIFQRVLRRVLGFDIIHAWKNWDAINAADVVWTHTESEYLACSFLRLVLGRRFTRPKVIAQSIWLFDLWPSLSLLRRAFYRTLLSHTNMLTVHSDANLQALKSLGLHIPCQVVRFGVSLDSFPMRVHQREAFHEPLRIFAAGNDRHRDWNTFAEAFSQLEGVQIRVASGTFPVINGKAPISVVQASYPEMVELYKWADIVVVPLTQNLHASGVTVILEAVTFGKPVIATDTGGLAGYFRPGEILFVPADDPQALIETTRHARANAAAVAQMALRAQERLIKEDYSTDGYARRHVELSRAIAEF